MVGPVYEDGRAVWAIVQASAAAVLAAAKAAAGPYDSARRPPTATARACPPTITLVASTIASAGRVGGTARSVRPNTVTRCGA
ncbi:hypothetical protein [Streptomyces sp. NPDC001604]|uniref:hypothetical protein n=1 Tax=Streptomyces sp. NPDC001604 TaxID=3364593 RepID=UPI0036922A91